MSPNETFSKIISHFWSHSAVIAPNNFVFKSFSNWAFNIAAGCSHACRFCYVPDVATIKQASGLATYGVQDPDAERGRAKVEAQKAADLTVPQLEIQPTLCA